MMLPNEPEFPEPEVARANMQAAKRLYDRALRDFRAGEINFGALRYARAVWNCSMTCYLETLNIWKPTI